LPEGQHDDLKDRAQVILDTCVGENLDQLATLDMRGDGMLRVLFHAARELQGASLVLTAARLLADHVAKGRRVLILTGFLSPRAYPETDGLIGSAVLAATLERACGAVPVFVCEPEVIAPLSAALRAAGLNVCPQLADTTEVPHATVVLPFPRDRSAAEVATTELANQIDPTVCIAIERPGANTKGQYHFAMGKNVSVDIAPVDLLYSELSGRGVPTIGVGDFGNELGMGKIYDAVCRETPAGANCGCGCGGGTACAIPADATVIVSVSDWGAYAIAACFAYLRRDPTVLVGSDVYRRILEDTVRAGAIDGPTGYALPYVDGIDARVNVALLEVMRAAVEYPAKTPAHPELRLFRARRAGKED